MKLNIQGRVNLLFIGIILLFGLVLGFYFVNHETAALNAELNERGNLLLNSLSVSSEYPILIKDKESISRIVEGTLTESAVVYCKIEDKKGTALAEKGVKG